MRRKIILGLIVIAIFSIAWFKYSQKSHTTPHNFVIAKKGNITQKISATGQVTLPKKIDLQFEIPGKIKEKRVEVGKEIKKGDVLVVLETKDLETELAEAEANYELAKANLKKILAGASEEEIRIYETQVENAKIEVSNAQKSLDDAKKNLENVKKKAEVDLESAYKSTLFELQNAINVGLKALLSLTEIQYSYFTGYTQEAIKIAQKKARAVFLLLGRENSGRVAKEVLTTLEGGAKAKVKKALNEPTFENIDEAFSQTIEALKECENTLESVPIKSKMSTTDKEKLFSEKDIVSKEILTLSSLDQKIRVLKAANQQSIDLAQNKVNTAQANLKRAEGNLNSALSQLAKIKAPPREVDINLAEAKVHQAEALVKKAKLRLEKARLISPCEGIVTEVRKKEGEVIQPQIPVISIICKSNFQIEVDVPEADIAKIDLEDPVKISLDALPEKVLEGKVAKIDPAEKIIQGVVYYKVTVEFDKIDKRVKPGMTADVDIITGRKENVLLVPQTAVFGKNGKNIVRVLDNGEIKEVEVETGIEGSEGEIEILSGLKEGDKVIPFIKD